MRDVKLRRSRAQEERVAKQYAGSRSPMSGAGSSRKNDVRNESLLIECKRTDSMKSITIKFSDLRDLERNAAIEGRTPALNFNLGGRSYWIITDDDFRSTYSPS